MWHPVPLEFIVTGPLDGQGLHLCLAPRLWNKNFQPDIHEEDTEFTCADGCSEVCNVFSCLSRHSIYVFTSATINGF